MDVKNLECIPTELCCWIQNLKNCNKLKILILIWRQASKGLLSFFNNRSKVRVTERKTKRCETFYLMSLENYQNKLSLWRSLMKCRMVALHLSLLIDFKRQNVSRLQRFRPLSHRATGCWLKIIKKNKTISRKRDIR